MLKYGIDNFEELKKIVGTRRVGVITNPSGMDCNGHSSAALIAEKLRLTALFGPEHGVRGDVPAGGKVEGGQNREFGVPEYSLYGDTLRPTAEQLAEIDVMVYDLQDVGLRSYTFLSTLVNTMEACAEASIPVVVLDRPNPLGGETFSGVIAAAETAAFVAMLPIPYRHGLSSGEFALLARKLRAPGCDLSVVRCSGWNRGDFRTFSVPWIPPSPALPSYSALLGYATNYLLQATNFSHGRGTAEPFTLLGAPYADAPRLTEKLERLHLPGVRFFPAYFVPSTFLYPGTSCGGSRMVITDADTFLPFETGVRIFETLRESYPADFRIESPDYFDSLAGTVKLRSGEWSGSDFLRHAEADSARFAAETVPEVCLYGTGGSYDKSRA